MFQLSSVIKRVRSFLCSGAMKDPKLPRGYLAVGHSLQPLPPEPQGHDESCWCPEALCKNQVKNKKLLPLGGNICCVCAAEKSPLQKKPQPDSLPVPCSSSSSSSFPAVLPFLVSILMHSPPCVSGTGAGCLPARGCIKGDVVRGSVGGSSAAAALPRLKATRWGCGGSHGGVPQPREPSWASPLGNHTPKGSEMGFPRKLQSLWVVDGGGSLP